MKLYTTILKVNIVLRGSWQNKNRQYTGMVGILLEKLTK